MQILYSVITALCLCIGFYFGFKLGRYNELPKLKSIKTIKEEKEKGKEDEENLNRFIKSINNLNGYTGSSKGQEEIV